MVLSCPCGCSGLCSSLSSACMEDHRKTKVNLILMLVSIQLLLVCSSAYIAEVSGWLNSAVEWLVGWVADDAVFVNMFAQKLENT